MFGAEAYFPLLWHQSKILAVPILPRRKSELTTDNTRKMYKFVENRGPSISPKFSVQLIEMQTDFETRGSNRSTFGG